MTAKAMDPRLEDSIWRAIEGEDSSWPTHKKFRGGKDFEKMFKAGDQQALLWAIYDRAKKKKAIPQWAADALKDVLFRAVTGKYSTWDGAFGKIFNDRSSQEKYQRLARMFDVFDKVEEFYSAKRQDGRRLHKRGKPVYKLVADELKLLGARSPTAIETLYKLAKRDLGYAARVKR